MATYVVTGCSRGLGLAMVKELVSRGSEEVSLVIAATRNYSPVLDEIIKQEKGSGRIVFVPLDVSTHYSSTLGSVEKTASILQGRGVDILTNCAGVHSDTHGKVDSMSDLDHQLTVNVVGVHNVICAFLPLLQMGRAKKKKKKIANLSSVFTSMAQAQRSAYAPCPAYKISKAALNA